MRFWRFFWFCLVGFSSLTSCREQTLELATVMKGGWEFGMAVDSSKTMTESCFSNPSVVYETRNSKIWSVVQPVTYNGKCDQFGPIVPLDTFLLDCNNGICTTSYISGESRSYKVVFFGYKPTGTIMAFVRSSNGNILINKTLSSYIHDPFAYAAIHNSGGRVIETYEELGSECRKRVEAL